MENPNIQKLRNWQRAHWGKVRTIIFQNDVLVERIAEYFLYDNLKSKHPDFCHLFKINSFCHEGVSREKFCCFFCACPYFSSLGEEDGIYGKCLREENSSRRLANGFLDCVDCTFIHDLDWSRKNIELRRENNI